MPHPSNKPQKESPSFRISALDKDFLLSDSMRGARLLLEYSKADEYLCKWGIRSTIVVFGSLAAKPGSKMYEEARKFARIVSEKGGAMNPEKGGPFHPTNGWRDNVIATGGGPGIMEAANRGANEVGAPTIGFNITLPTVQEPNPYTTPELTFQFHYFALRKMHLAMRAKALVVFPGGFGTLDELFEILTLRQTSKMADVPIILVNRHYWTSLINFDLMINEGMISKDDMRLFTFAETAEEAWETLLHLGLKQKVKKPTFRKIEEEIPEAKE